jgi:hypothetical protein
LQALFWAFGSVLQVRSSNTLAIKLYESLGFAEEGRKTKRLKYGPDDYQDDVYMALWVRKCEELPHGGVMSEVKIDPQTFSGVSGEIKAFLHQNENSAASLAVLLPGAGYSFREPLLRYSIQILLKKGYKVLALDKVYGDDPAWRSLTVENAVLIPLLTPTELLQLQ